VVKKIYLQKLETGIKIFKIAGMPATQKKKEKERRTHRHIDKRKGKREKNKRRG
jgi:hypothetical protein